MALYPVRCCHGVSIIAYPSLVSDQPAWQTSEGPGGKGERQAKRAKRGRIGRARMLLPFHGLSRRLVSDRMRSLISCVGL